MGRRALLILTIVVGAWWATTDSAGAACAAPTLTLVPTTVAPGTSTTVTGAGFMAECRDVIAVPTSAPLPPVEPIRNIPIRFEQGGTSVTLATVDAADADFRCRITVQVPPSAQPGPATITALDSSAPLTVTDAPGPPQQLARTGSGVHPAGLGVVVVLIGLGAVLLAVRTRRPGHAR